MLAGSSYYNRQLIPRRINEFADACVSNVTRKSRAQFHRMPQYFGAEQQGRFQQKLEQTTECLEFFRLLLSSKSDSHHHVATLALGRNLAANSFEHGYAKFIKADSCGSCRQECVHALRSIRAGEGKFLSVE